MMSCKTHCKARAALNSCGAREAPSTSCCNLQTCNAPPCCQPRQPCTDFCLSASRSHLQAWEPIRSLEDHAAFLRKDFPALPPEWIPEVGGGYPPVGWVGGWAGR